VTVEAGLGGFKDHATVGAGREFDDWGEVCVTKEQFAAILGLPIPIEIKEQVETAFQAEGIVVTEIGVDVEEPTVSNAVGASFDEIGIRQETGDSGQAFQEMKERAAVELVKDVSKGRGEKELFQSVLAPTRDHFVLGVNVGRSFPGRIAGRRECFEQGLVIGEGEEMIQANIRKR
jgi:hypothetical protein